MNTNTVEKFRWDDMPKEAVTDMFSRRLIWGEKVMLAQVMLKKGTIVQKHSHVNEQVSHITHGVLRFWIGDEDRMMDLRAGDVLVIPSSVPHRAEALEDMVAIDVFSPPREDWINKTDDYLRRK
jgi:quercetin dioxygenase-like cupin family protein